MSKIYFDVINEQEVFKIDEKKLENTAVKMLEFLEKTAILEQTFLKDYDLAKTTLIADVMICDNERIREINRDYRQKDKPTDVITFALFADDKNSCALEDEIHLGEIIISAEQTQIQADENKKTFEKELQFLLSHGILHLLGFDHQDEKSYEFMMQLQDKMLENV